MIFNDVVHGSPEWYMLRCGIPTSSEFGKIITPKTAQLSKGADKYMNVLLAELAMREPIDTVGSSYWIDRGNELEAAARCEYEFLTGNEVVHGGFITDDDGKYGTSPDGRILAKNGLVEFKCPAPQTHIEYALTGSIEDDYRPQLQGQLLITGCDWVDIYSYHPQIKGVPVRVKRDEEYIAKLKNALENFRERMNSKCEDLIDRGYIVIDKAPAREPQVEEVFMAG
ncbi:MAG: lambda exonuclease family protein [Pseudomonadota bacterium]